MADTAGETKKHKKRWTGADQKSCYSSEDDPFSASGSKLSEVYLSTSQTEPPGLRSSKKRGNKFAPIDPWSNLLPAANAAAPSFLPATGVRPRQPGTRPYSSSREKIAKISEVCDNAGFVRQTVESPRSGHVAPGKSGCAARESSKNRDGVKKRGDDGEKVDHENTRMHEAATEAGDNHCQEMMLLLQPILEQISSPVSTDDFLGDLTHCGLDTSPELDGKPYKGESVNTKAGGIKKKEWATLRRVQKKACGHGVDAPNALANARASPATEHQQNQGDLESDGEEEFLRATKKDMVGKAKYKKRKGGKDLLQEKSDKVGLDSPEETCERGINPDDSELLWYEAQENDTLRSIARVLEVPPLKLLELNIETFPSLTLSARLRRETTIIIPESSDCIIVGDAGGDVGAEVSKRPMCSPKPSQSSHSGEQGEEGEAAAAAVTTLPVQKPEHMQHNNIKRQERCGGKRPATDRHQLDQSVDPRAGKRVSKSPVLLSSTQLRTPERSARVHRSFSSSQRPSNDKHEDREGQTKLMEAEGLLRKVEAVIDKGDILSQKSHADPSKVLAGLERKLVEADIMLELVPGARGIETARSLQSLHKKLSIDVVRLKILDFTDCFPNQACSWKSAESWENWKGQVKKAQDAAALAVAVGSFFAQLVDQVIVFQKKKGGNPADIKTTVTRWCKECSSTADLRTIISRVEGAGACTFSKDIASPSKELGLIDWKKIRFWFTQQRHQDTSSKQSGGGGVAICTSLLSAAAARKQGSKCHSEDSSTAGGRKQRKRASEGNRDETSTACASESAQGGGGTSNSSARTCAHTCASQSSEADAPTTNAPQWTLSAQSAEAGGRCGSRDADASGGLTDAADAANCVKQTLESAEGRVWEDAVECCMSPLVQRRCKTPLMPGRIADIDDDCFNAGGGCAGPHDENLPGEVRDGETAGLVPQEQDVCHNVAQAQEPKEVAQEPPSCNTPQQATAQTSSLPPDVGLVTKEDFVPDSEGEEDEAPPASSLKAGEENPPPTPDRKIPGPQCSAAWERSLGVSVVFVGAKEVSSRFHLGA